MKQQAAGIINKSRDIGWVMEPYAKDLLRIYGMKTTTYRWVKTPDAVAHTAAELGYPLVMKVVSPDIVHKTEVNGVIVGIKDDDSLARSFKDLSRLRGFDGVIVEKMERGVELIVGAKEDPQFETIVLFGIGGTSVEVYKDVAIRIAPIAKQDALQAMRSLQGAPLLDGHRGAKAVNKNRLADLIVSFSKMAYDLRGQVESVDLNPVFCNEREAVIADARFILKK